VLLAVGVESKVKVSYFVPQYEFNACKASSTLDLGALLIVTLPPTSYIVGECKTATPLLFTVLWPSHVTPLTTAIFPVPNKDSLLTVLILVPDTNASCLLFQFEISAAVIPAAASTSSAVIKPLSFVN